MIGRTIHRYRIEGKLGEGGMGTVWLAEDTLLGRPVALKLLGERLGETQEAWVRFLREARAACALSHPGIATVYDAGEDGGKVFIAFEYVDGETVAERVKREPLAVEEALRLAREAAGALGHAHDQGILHRDVTSRNLMIDRQGKVKVVDFGLALPEGETRITRSGSALGTVGYMSPEAARGLPADRRSDLYGLGVVLYEMLTGELPFTAERAEAVLYAVVHEKVEPPGRRREGVPEGVEHVVLRLLEKDPGRRHSAAPELVADLLRLERGEAVESPRRIVPVPRGRRARVLLGAAALVLAILTWQDPFGFRGRPPLYRSVAVLPFENVSESPEESGYLASGLGEALAARLTRVGSLQVAPWLSSQRYATRFLPFPDISRELNVQALLSGTFRSDGDRLRVSLSLVDGESGSTSWVEEFEAKKTELLVVTERIAVSVARHLKGGLTASEEKALGRAPTTDVDAYYLHLRGVAMLQAEDRISSREALGYFEEALALDPTLAEAHVGIGAVHNMRYFFGWGGGLECLDAAESSFRRALELDPDLTQARRGLVRVYQERGETEECLKLGKEVRDSGKVTIETLFTQAEAYLFGDMPGEAVPLLRTIRRIDPANRGCLWTLVFGLNWSGRYEESIAAGEEYLRKFGEDAEVHFWMGLSNKCLGDVTRARSHIDRSLELYGDGASSYVYAGGVAVCRALADDREAERIARQGIEVFEARLAAYPDNVRTRASLALLHGLRSDEKGVGREARQVLSDAPDNGVALHLLAQAYVAIGDVPRATEMLRRALEGGNVADPEKLFFASCWEDVFPRIHELEISPEYQAYLAEVRRRWSRLRSRYAS